MSYMAYEDYNYDYANESLHSDLYNLPDGKINFSNPQEVSLYIHFHLGPIHIPLTTLLPISCIYVLLFVVGVLGNLSVLVVICRNKYMQTPTNLYLANLAFSDLLTHLLVMPPELYVMWHQYPWPFGSAACAIKFLAICGPLGISAAPSSDRAFQQAMKNISKIWAAGIILSLPWIYYNKVNYLLNLDTGEKIEESSWCAVPWNEMTDAPLYILAFTTILTFAIPFTFVTFAYVEICLAIKRSSSQANDFRYRFRQDQLLSDHTTQASGTNNGTHEGGALAAAAAERNSTKERTAVIRMLLAVVIAFFICWAPFHSQRLMFAIFTLKGTWNSTTGLIHHVLFLISGIGYYLSSCINPILYSVFSARFRRAFLALFERRRRQARPANGINMALHGHVRPLHPIPRPPIVKPKCTKTHQQAQLNRRQTEIEDRL